MNYRKQEQFEVNNLSNVETDKKNSESGLVKDFSNYPDGNLSDIQNFFSGLNLGTDTPAHDFSRTDSEATRRFDVLKPTTGLIIKKPEAKTSEKPHMGASPLGYQRRDGDISRTNMPIIESLEVPDPDNLQKSASVRVAKLMREARDVSIPVFEKSTEEFICEEIDGGLHTLNAMIDLMKPYKGVYKCININDLMEVFKKMNISVDRLFQMGLEISRREALEYGVTDSQLNQLIKIINDERSKLPKDSFKYLDAAENEVLFKHFRNLVSATVRQLVPTDVKEDGKPKKIAVGWTTHFFRISDRIPRLFRTEQFRILGPKQVKVVKKQLVLLNTELKPFKTLLEDSGVKIF